MAKRVERRKIVVEGIVQGVGFRPFVYQQAVRLGLAGTVCNDTRGVTIEIEGEIAALEAFVAVLHLEKPPLAVIQEIIAENIPVRGTTGFAIISSSCDAARRVQVSPDTHVCDECLRELFDPADRRYRYPFINCTNCGPRYTIVTGIPYDRPLTTMADFPLCAACREEYEDPASRRFHAQPNACPACGPSLSLIDRAGVAVSAGEALSEAVRRLKAGEIIAIKGLGGYHLAVDASQEAAVLELRRRKQRDEKPFALMARDMDAVHAFAVVGGDEARLLAGVEKPIVLLPKRAGHGLAASIAPANRCFGVMLPYTPLHHLLLAEGFAALVMTSANLSDEPIAFEDDEARCRLYEIADAFLAHDRRIHSRTDDSIARVMAGRPLLLRRSRGFVPRALALSTDLPSVLAVGAELKNTVCLTRGDRAFLSQHIGDLKNLEVLDSFKQAIDSLQTLLQVVPERIAHDLHPDYYSTHYALEESGLPCVAVQHHHAHLAIGVIFDGIGYGEDGHAWGGEFLVGDLHSYERAGHFKYQPMPGGDLATREPWRMALSYLLTGWGEVPKDSKALAGVPPAAWTLVAQAMTRGINAPLTSSCGRLFDAVAALLGLRHKVSFEGQAAMQLEMVADPQQDQPYPYVLEDAAGRLVFDPHPMLAAILRDVDTRTSDTVIAGRFHVTLAAMITEVSDELRHRTGLDRVVLSGGVFQNALLTELAVPRLARAGFTVLTHSLVPPNDGGLSLGQAVVAAGSRR